MERTLEEELNRMGVLEENVPEVAKAIRNAAVCSTYSIDNVLGGLRMLMDLERPKAPALNLNKLVSTR